MPRGGAREGAGGISKWKHGKTKTIRVPVALADKVLALAREIDSGDSHAVLKRAIAAPVMAGAKAGDKVLDLSGIQMTHVNGEIAVKLEDLVRRGVVLHPQHLAKMVEARISRRHSTKQGI